MSTPDQIIQELQEQIAQLRDDLTDLQGRMQTLEIVKPPALRALSLADLQKVVADNPYAELEVLEDWRHPAGDSLPAGRQLRADHYKELETFVRYGLKLGIPESHDALVAKLKEQGDVRRANVRKAHAEAMEQEAQKAAQRAEIARNLAGQQSA